MISSAQRMIRRRPGPGRATSVTPYPPTWLGSIVALLASTVAASLMLIPTAGCSSIMGGEVEPYAPAAQAGFNRREHAGQMPPDMPAPPQPTRAAERADQPGGPAQASTDLAEREGQPSQGVSDSLKTDSPEVANPDATGSAMVFDTNRIIHLIHENGPNVEASREEMVAAQHALREFRTNLSRFEPFVETKGDAAQFPQRLDARGITGEIVGGLEKETFEGAILRVEGGASMSDFTFDEAEEEEDRVERGSGGLVRARVEVPFIGSRRRQERVINAAFQESQARKAKLDYLSSYRNQVETALSYYLYAIYYRDYAEIFKIHAEQLERLLNHPQVLPEDKLRLNSSIDNAGVSRDAYINSEEAYTRLLLALLGIPMTADVKLEEPPREAGRYLERVATPEGQQGLLTEAHENNPRFRVLNDAIADAELQRRQAILGRYDLTAFVQGTQYSFGAETFDDRVGGWEVGGGVSVRLNDDRVLRSSKLKAEAQIRQYQAEIEAERYAIERKVINNSETLRSRYKIIEDTRHIREQKREEFERRVAIYLDKSRNGMTIDDVLQALSEWTNAETTLASSWYYLRLAEARLMSATGEVYRMVGMQVSERDSVEETPNLLGF